MKQLSMFNKAKSYATSLLSRGLGALGYSGKVSGQAKRARKMSCNGIPDRLLPCPHREPSQKIPGSFYCGACGCGDKKAVLVSGDTPEYEKLDYPHLVCPIKMPGYSNYIPSGQDDAFADRKSIIEQEYGVSKLITMRNEQKRIFRIQQVLEKGYAVFKDPRKVGRRLRRVVSRVFEA